MRLYLILLFFSRKKIVCGANFFLLKTYPPIKFYDALFWLEQHLHMLIITKHFLRVYSRAVKKLDNYFTTLERVHKFYKFEKKVLICLLFNETCLNPQICSRLLRCCTARGSSAGSCLAGSTKVKARKFVLFTKSSLVVWNKEYLVDFLSHSKVYRRYHQWHG